MTNPLTAEEIQTLEQLGRLEDESSDRILNAQEERIVRGMLINERQIFTILDHKIDRLEPILVSLREQRKICVSRMNRHSVALRPQKRLPSEILAEIFVRSTDDKQTTLSLGNTSPPWALLGVCTRWRQVTLAEHQLWSHLDVQAPNLRPTRNLVATWLPLLWG